MYAVINDRGNQYRASVGERITLDRLEGDVGSTVEVPVLLVADGEAIEIGQPQLDKKAVLKLVSHSRGKKGIAGTFKRRKDSRRRVGFRHDHTVVEVVSLG